MTDIVKRLDMALTDFWSHTRLEVIRDAKVEIEWLKAALVQKTDALRLALRETKQ